MKMKNDAILFCQAQSMSNPDAKDEISQTILALS
jgi:hypothetical protein